MVVVGSRLVFLSDFHRPVLHLPTLYLVHWLLPRQSQRQGVALLLSALLPHHSRAHTHRRVCLKAR